MMRKSSRLAAALASAAAFSMMATPAMAQGWGGWGGWGGGYRHHDRGVDAGDVIAGVLILGGIAAIASAASNSNKNRRYERRDYPQRDDNYGRDYSREDRPEWQGSSSDINGAISRCLDSVSRGSGRGEQVDSVSRDGDGWRVSGRTGSGESFACSVDRDGRIRDIDVDGRHD